MSQQSDSSTYYRFSRKLVAVSLVTLALAGCQDRGTKSLGNLIGAYPRANHPIVVSKRALRHSVAVSRHDYSLDPSHYGDLKRFIWTYRDQGRGSLKVKAPTGTPNETAAYNVMATVRDIISAAGIPDEAVIFRPYSGGADPEAPIILEYTGYVATPAPCGDWSKDLGKTRKNLPYPELGCAYQNNMAVMIANPRDLVEPRGMDPRDSERRDVTWGKYIKGADTTSKKSKDQKASRVGGKK